MKNHDDNSPVQSFTLRTKLTPQENIQKSIRRERLHPADLETFRAISVVAPAGYGKSTLMAQWTETLLKKGGQASWLSLSAEDNDLARFFRYLVAACDQLQPGICRNTQAILASGPTPDSQYILELLIHDLEPIRKHSLLCIDDFHLITNRTLHQALQWLLHHLPPRLTLAIASRNELPVNLNKLRVQGRLASYEYQKLNFNEEEIRRFFNQNNFDLDENLAKELQDKTEGWIAVLQMISILTQDQGQLAEFIKGFSGKNRDLGAYLEEVVLQKQTPEIKEFLLKTSVLDRLSADLCSHLVPAEQIQSIIESIEAHHLFLIPLDRERHWYRYHHLFGDFLKSTLKRQDPKSYRELNHRASLWFEENGSLSEAIDYALKAESFDRAATLLSGYATELVHHLGEHQSLFHWVSQIPAKNIDRHPSILLATAWSAIFTSQYQKCKAALGKIDRIVAQPLPSDHPTDRKALLGLQCFSELLRIVYDSHTAKAEAPMRKAKTWFQRWPDAGEYEWSIVNVALSSVYIYINDFESGLAALHQTKYQVREAKNYYFSSWCTALEIVLLNTWGKLDEALLVGEDGLNFVTAALPPQSFGPVMIKLHMAELLAEKGEIEKAYEYLRQGLRYTKDNAGFGTIIYSHTAFSHLSIHLRKFEEAETLLLKAEKLGLSRGTPILSFWLRAERMFLYQCSHQLKKAKLLVQEGFPIENSDDYRDDHFVRGIFQELRDISIIRYKIMEGKARQSIPQLEAILDRARENKRFHFVIRHQVLLATAYAQTENHTKARKILREALALGLPRGFHLTYLLEGHTIQKTILEVLEELHDPSIPPEAKERLQKLLQNQSGSLEDPKPLSTREAEILRFLDSSKSLKEIASSLHISMPTLKWHLRNIYRKLGVASRIAAVTKSRSATF